MKFHLKITIKNDYEESIWIITLKKRFIIS